MQAKKISDAFAVMPQIQATDVPAIAAAGYKSIICNRPDGETPGQPPYEPIAKAAHEHGLAFRYLPVTSGSITPDNVRDLDLALEQLPAPVLAYCRSGARSTMLWTMSRAGQSR